MNARIAEGYTMPDFTEEYLRRFGMDKSNVDPIRISHALGIKVITYREAADLFMATGLSELTKDDNDGFCVKVRKQIAIFYDDTRSPERQRTTVAHELGHVELGHLMAPCPPCKGHRCDECREWQADSFALTLLF